MDPRWLAPERTAASRARPAKRRAPVWLWHPLWAGVANPRSDVEDRRQPDAPTVLYPSIAQRRLQQNQRWGALWQLHRAGGRPAVGTATEASPRPRLRRPQWPSLRDDRK